ncbi:major facilitator superfamily domain-containing protein [Phialemonium atrogriseum]|uniref:Major facilitator superfamily domain-containing protein n=1 Tax=Phialemonium atrogriseum TaxID=1093897 RepID=A0AAJ0BYA0_9PEZI|nr:major facilitator superfamily domain-containing protein [Phialemonium atrogriseum]KAK1765304.1 major facilitator superfamily domain-containing protein [Phialemonium atrogriseum]
MDKKQLHQPTEPRRAHIPNDPATLPFSTFTAWEKRWILFLGAFAAMFSPMSSFIFYPAITSMAEGLGVTTGLINLAVTTYMVVSGIVPSLLGNVADKLGRRPVYIMALSIYFVANVGLALQNSFPALLVLRMVQSAGSSGTISLGYGIISDIASPAERGLYVGIFNLGPNVAPPIGPILGGVLGARLGWKWIFWFLCIIGGVCLVLILITLPETARCLVGNGSIPAKRINRTFWSLLTDKGDQISRRMESNERPKVGLPNPLASLKLLLLHDVAIIVVCNGVCYANYCSLQASLSSLFIDMYDYQELQAGLIYLPFGGGCLFSVYAWGKLLNYDYSRTAKEQGVDVDVAREDCLDNFPIEKARLRNVFYLIGLNTIATISYGWALHRRVHVAIPLMLQAVLGFASSGIFVALLTLLTDLNPERSSTASASANIVRCGLAAALLAVLQPLIDRVGVGWCFTFLGALCGLCGPLLLLEVRRGPEWRRSRKC